MWHEAACGGVRVDRRGAMRQGRVDEAGGDEVDPDWREFKREVGGEGGVRGGGYRPDCAADAGRRPLVPVMDSSVPPGRTSPAASRATWSVSQRCSSSARRACEVHVGQARIVRGGRRVGGVEGGGAQRAEFALGVLQAVGVAAGEDDVGSLGACSPGCLEPDAALPPITMTVCPGSSGSCWGEIAGGVVMIAPASGVGAGSRCRRRVRERRLAHGPGPGQPARVFTGATGRPETRPWKRAETRGLEPRPWT